MITKYEKKCGIGIIVAIIFMALMYYFGEIKEYPIIAQILGIIGTLIGVVSVSSLFIYALPDRVCNHEDRD